MWFFFSCCIRNCVSLDLPTQWASIFQMSQHMMLKSHAWVKRMDLNVRGLNVTEEKHICVVSDSTLQWRLWESITYTFRYSKWIPWVRSYTVSMTGKPGLGSGPNWDALKGTRDSAQLSPCSAAWCLRCLLCWEALPCSPPGPDHGADLVHGQVPRWPELSLWPGAQSAAAVPAWNLTGSWQIWEWSRIRKKKS